MRRLAASVVVGFPVIGGLAGRGEERSPPEPSPALAVGDRGAGRLPSGNVDGMANAVVASPVRPGGGVGVLMRTEEAANP